MIGSTRRSLVVLSGLLGIGIATVAIGAATSPITGPVLAAALNHCEPFARPSLEDRL